jgi:hypothetical protein
MREGGEGLGYFVRCLGERMDVRVVVGEGFVVASYVRGAEGWELGLEVAVRPFVDSDEGRSGGRAAFGGVCQ